MALIHRSPGLQETPQWRIHESKLVSRSQGAGDIACKVLPLPLLLRHVLICLPPPPPQLYLPKSSVFCLSEPIPFHLSFVASAMSLAALLPFVPSANPYASGRPSTRIQLLRQTSVDVK